MRDIKYIVIHCTATSQKATVSGILKYWEKELGWKNVGYHRIIKPNGEIEKLADFDQVTNGVRGYNSNSIHISYIGGLNGDDRTEEQKASILGCILEAIDYVGKDVIIQGHRDFPNVKKACPNFDAKSEYKWIMV